MENTPNEVVLMLGGNVGDTLTYFDSAYTFITKNIGDIAMASAVYQSEPWGLHNQPAFLNQALRIHTLLSPFEVMDQINFIEKMLGKVKTVKNGPRTIDIDILFYNHDIIKTGELEIPHPRLHLRRFNLVPLGEIIPDFIHPVLNKSIISLLESCPDSLPVTLLTTNKSKK